MSATSVILQRLNLYRTFPAIILAFVIQACAASAPVGPPIGPGSAPPTNPAFDAYDACIQDADANQQDCFKQAIQANHLTMPAGTTTDQVFAKFKDCAKNGPLSVSVGDRTIIGGKEQNAFRQNCFASALQ